MQKLMDMTAVHEAEVAVIRQQSALLLQKRENGFNGELHSAGALVENYVKGLLQKHLPHGFRICSGYIATTETFADSANHAQHDIIIVDNRIPPLYSFGISDIEVVAAESVCAIIEVKRILTQEAVSKAIAHLRKTKQVLDGYDNGVKSKDRAMNNAVSVTMTVATASPMYAIIGLDADKEICERGYFNATTRPAIDEFLDLLWAPAAPYVAGFGLRSTQDGSQCSAIHVSRSQSPYESNPFSMGFNAVSSGHVHQAAIWAFRTWVNNIAGVTMDASKNMKYFGLAT